MAEVCQFPDNFGFVAQRHSYNLPRERRERRIVLTGESPVRVSAGAPGSRLRSQGEIRAARRSVKGPCNRGEQTPRAATIRERNSLDKLAAERCLGEPSFSCHSE